VWSCGIVSSSSSTRSRRSWHAASASAAFPPSANPSGYIASANDRQRVDGPRDLPRRIDACVVHEALNQREPQTFIFGAAVTMMLTFGLLYLLAWMEVRYPSPLVYGGELLTPALLAAALVTGAVRLYARSRTALSTTEHADRGLSLK
jgi:hypothetical protein